MEVYAQLDLTYSGLFHEQEYLWKMSVPEEHTIESNIEQDVLDEDIPHIEDGYIIRHLKTNGLCIVDYRFVHKKDALLKIGVTEDCILMEFLLGNTGSEKLMEIKVNGISGRHNLQFLKGGNKLYYLKNNTTWNSFSIYMSKDFYFNLIGKTNILHSDFAKAIQEGRDTQLVDFYLPLSFDMENVIEKVRNCTRTGSLHRLCLEIKIQELLLLQFEQSQGMIVKSTPKYHLHDNDIERIKSTKIILEENYNTPPTIQLLSRMVGINEYKLKKGFKELFGFTIHEYVIKYRMEMANQMVKEQNLQIKEISIELGYKNPSHFSAAFKKHFGFLPTEMV